MAVVTADGRGDKHSEPYMSSLLSPRSLGSMLAQGWDSLMCWPASLQCSSDCFVLEAEDIQAAWELVVAMLLAACWANHRLYLLVLGF